MIHAMTRVYVSLKNRTKLVRKRSVHHARIFFTYHLKKEAKEPVFVLAARRTGSNLLLSYLNSVPGVSFALEILNESTYYGIRSQFVSKNAVLRHVAYSLNACENKVCGTKILKTQLETHRIGMDDLTRCFPNARFIILYRKSLVDQFVSLKIAEKAEAQLIHLL